MEDRNKTLDKYMMLDSTNQLSVRRERLANRKSALKDTIHATRLELWKIEDDIEDLGEGYNTSDKRLARRRERLVLNREYVESKLEEEESNLKDVCLEEKQLIAQNLMMDSSQHIVAAKVPDHVLFQTSSSLSSKTSPNKKVRKEVNMDSESSSDSDCD